MKNLVVGLDVSKDWFDFFGMDQNRKIVLEKGQFDNEAKAILAFIKKLKSLRDYKIWVCMEYTGVYGDLLSAMLSKYKITYSLLNPLELKFSMGLVRGKTDAVDAYRIALYGVRHAAELQPSTLSEQNMRLLRLLLSQRSLSVKTCTQYKNHLAALKISAKSLDVGDLADLLSESIAMHEQIVAKLDRRINALIKASASLKKNYNKMLQVIGVGPVTASYMLLKTDNFTKFTDPRKFACFCGIAPFRHQSGSSVRGKTRTDPKADKKMKAILMNATSSAIRHDPQLKAYYNRKIKEGKNEFSVKNAVANKLVLRLFAVVKREEPFVKLAA